MAIIIPVPVQQPVPQRGEIPKYQSYMCPFCDYEKEIRYEQFDPETGKIDTKTMSVSSYKNLIINNNVQPQLKNICRPVECYCNQCYISFSISNSLGII